MFSTPSIIVWDKNSSRFFIFLIIESSVVLFFPISIRIFHKESIVKATYIKGFHCFPLFFNGLANSAHVAWFSMMGHGLRFLHFFNWYGMICHFFSICVMSVDLLRVFWKTFKGLLTYELQRKKTPNEAKPFLAFLFVKLANLKKCVC